MRTPRDLYSEELSITEKKKVQLARQWPHLDSNKGLPLKTITSATLEDMLRPHYKAMMDLEVIVKQLPFRYHDSEP
jgi:hypothetical protein